MGYIGSGASQTKEYGEAGGYQSDYVIDVSGSVGTTQSFDKVADGFRVAIKNTGTNDPASITIDVNGNEQNHSYSYSIPADGTTYQYEETFESQHVLEFSASGDAVGSSGYVKTKAHIVELPPHVHEI